MAEGLPHGPEVEDIENGHFDETMKFGVSLLHFLQENIRNYQNRDHSIEFSGGTNGFEVLSSPDAAIDFVKTTKQGGVIVSIHARLTGSSDDIYLTGEALLDFLEK